METLADYAPLSKDPEILTEYVRQKLARSILRQYETAEGVLPIVSLDPADRRPAAGEDPEGGLQGTYLALEPGLAQTNPAVHPPDPGSLAQVNYQPVLLCSPLVRRHLKKLLDRFLPQVVVLSHSELTSQAKIQSLGTVSLIHAD